MATPNLFRANLVDGPLIKKTQTGQYRCSRIYLPDFASKQYKESSRSTSIDPPYKSSLAQFSRHQSSETFQGEPAKSLRKSFNQIGEVLSCNNPGKNQGEYIF